MQVTDTHFGSFPFVGRDLKTFRAIKQAVKQLEPDLLIHTGDLFWSKEFKDPVTAFESILLAFLSLDVPLVLTFGNHDAHEKTLRKQLGELFIEACANLIYPQEMALIDSRLNYCVDLYDHQGQACVNSLFILDSGGYSNHHYSTYEWLSDHQIQWFRQASATRQHVHDFMFHHIPLLEYRDAAQQIVAGQALVSPKNFALPQFNSGFFATLLDYPNIWGTFAGHDHSNNFEGMIYGKHLVYGNTSGYNCSGKIKRGVRVLDLNEKTHAVHTYVVPYES